MKMKAIASAQSVKAENKCYVVLQQAGIWNRKTQTFIAMCCAGISTPQKKQGSHKEILTGELTINYRDLTQPAPYSPVWSKLSSSHRLVP